MNDKTESAYKIYITFIYKHIYTHTFCKNCVVINLRILKEKKCRIRIGSMLCFFFIPLLSIIILILNAKYLRSEKSLYSFHHRQINIKPKNKKILRTE